MIVMLLAMAWDCIDGSGSYLLPHLSASRASIASVSVADDQTDRLLHIVGAALDAVSSSSPDDGKLRAESGWVHDTYVKGYFIRTALEFGEPKQGG